MGWKDELTPEELADLAPKDPLDHIVVSTGSMPGDYALIDLVYAIGTWDAGLVQGVLGKEAGVVIAMENAKRKLKAAAKTLGADAVLDVRFEMSAQSGRNGFLTGGKDVQVLAYGTAVQLHATPPPSDAELPRIRIHAGQLLVSLKLPQYIKNFADAKWSVDRLNDLTEPDLGSIGIADPSHREQILAEIKRLRRLESAS